VIAMQKKRWYEASLSIQKNMEKGKEVENKEHKMDIPRN
jgi:hypothetical protein